MEDILQNSTCPYRGLQPYSVGDFDIFFGRDEQAEVIISNLYVAPLTIVYGASGVGKSSVLAAGVVHKIRKSALDAVVLFRHWQSSNFLVELKKQIVAETARANRTALDTSPNQPLDALLEECSGYIRGQLLIVLDQFEEYFLYHVQTDITQPFEMELATAINRRDIKANVLLSLREDDLSKLDRFQGRIPNLLGNMLRIQHLDEASARDAISKPLQYFNDHLPPGESPVFIEDELVAAVISQVEAGQVTFSDHASALSAGDAVVTQFVEAPYLQLVLTRLWHEEMSLGSRKLRLATLSRLGSAQTIVRNHLDSALNNLSSPERAMAASVFRYLVTGSRKKYAHAPSSLAAWANLPERRVEQLLRRLAGPDMRVLRSIRTAGDEERYELFHDVLAPAVIEYSSKYRDRQRLRIILMLTLNLAVAMCLFIWASLGWSRAVSSRSYALFLMGERALDSRDPLSAEMILASSLSIKDTPETRDKILEARSYGVTILPSESRHVRNGMVFSLGDQIGIAGYDRDHVYLSGTVTSIPTSITTALPVNVYPVSFAVSKDGRVIAEGGNDGSVAVEDLPEIHKVLDLHLHQGPATCLALSHDGRELAVAGSDYTIRIFDLPTGRLIHSLPGHTDLVLAMNFSPDGRLLGSGGRDQTVKIWNLQQSKSTEFDDHEDVVTCISFSPDGQMMASGGKDRAIFLRSVAGLFDQQAVQGPPAVATRAVKLVGHESLVSSLAFSPDGRFLLSASKDRTARLWDIENAHTALVVVRAGASGLTSVAWSRAGDTFAATAEDGSLHSWGMSSSNGLVRTYRGHRHPVSSVVFCGDNDRLVTASTDSSDCSIKIWDIGKQDRPAININGQEDPIVWLAASKSSNLLASGGLHGHVRLFSGTTGRLIGDLPRHTRSSVWGLAFDNSGARLASGDDKGLVRVWQTQNRNLIGILHGDASKVYCVGWSPDNRWLAAGHRDGTISLWDMSKSPPTYQRLIGHSAAVWGLSFNPASSALASASEDETLRQWNLLTAHVSSIVMKGHQGEVWTVAFSPDGRQLASGSDDGTIRLWDAATAKQQMVIRSPQQTIWCVAYSPSGTFLASGGLDWTARLWDLSGAKHIHTASSSDLLAEAVTRTGLSLDDFDLRPVPIITPPSLGKPVQNQ